ncbi:MAG TPA: hypothetical protein PKJ99_11835 [Thermoanaerobaculales bacterium]|nr:hypothetical protein [Thermoanaerobaculales bacterium]
MSTLRKSIAGVRPCHRRRVRTSLPRFVGTMAGFLLGFAVCATAAAQANPRPVGGLTSPIPPLTLPYSSPEGADRVLVLLLANEHQHGRTYGSLPAMLLSDLSTSVANHLDAVSFGNVIVGGTDIYGIYPTRFDTLSGPYDGDAMVAGAMDSLQADGVAPDWQSYRFFIVVVDDVWDPHEGEDQDGDGLPDLPNGGLASRHHVVIGGEEHVIPGVVIAGFLTDNAREFVHAVAHELGHSIALGFPHSGALDCDGAQGDYFACRQGVSNGDRTDVMGNGGYFPGDRPRHFSGIFASMAGWLAPQNVIRDEPGVHVLHPLERDPGAGFPQLIVLRLQHKPPFDAGPVSDSYLTIEYRSGRGYDQGLEPGVLVKLMGARQLWNLTEAPLVEGDSFEDVHNRIRVEVLALYGDTAAVAVEEL